MPKDPVCGMELEGKDTAAAVSHEDVVYSFCSQRCAQQFLADPDSFVGVGAKVVTDPVCGMRFRLADTVFHRAEKGTVFHFCSEECFRKFTLDPRAYAYGAEVM